MVAEPVMKLPSILRPGLALAALAIIAVPCQPVRAAEHVTLRNGAEFDCVRQEPAGDRVRLYLLSSVPSGQAATDEANYIEVSASSVLRVETVPDPPSPAPIPLSTHSAAKEPASPPPATPVTAAEMRQMLARAGALHNIDTDLLASIVQAESNGDSRAISRAGAQGLMQLMPATASGLNVRNSFAPEENIGGGTAYLDQLLVRYHNDIRLAVAAYNAGPAAVDRYRGIPPYAETRAYVARVVREFNRRKRAALSAQAGAPTQPPAANADQRAAN
jgi:soluble lytic murein transglycosylase-like protein